MLLRWLVDLTPLKPNRVIRQTKLGCILENLISTNVAAKRLGISSSTFKRMCDTHSISLVRTPGGHRRIDSGQFAYVARLLRSRGLTPMQPTLSVQGVVEHLLEARSVDLINLLLSQSPEIGPLIQNLEDVFVPGLWRLGELLFRNEISAVQERVASTTASLVLDSLFTRLESRTDTNRTYVGGTFPPSDDTIASKLVSLSLLSIGVRGIHLGNSISAEAIAEAAELFHADAIWISHTHLLDLGQVVGHHENLARLLPPEMPVIVGGGGLSPAARRALSSCKYYDSIANMLIGESHKCDSSQRLAQSST
jgi:MerR family transcriptional regulator, light-induced transcriptional regulator